MKKASPNKLALKLKELRTARDYTQADVAGAIDIRQATYSHYETGARTPNSMILYKIANFYGMPVDDLLKLSIPLDDDVFFNAPDAGWFAVDENAFLEFSENSAGKELSREEMELLYHFSKLTSADRKEVISYAIFKHYQDAGVIPGRK